MKKKFLMMGAILVAGFAFTGCSDDDGTPDGDDLENEVSDDKNFEDTESSLTPEESKVKLETAAKSAMDIFNPDDQKPIVDFCDDFLAQFEDFEAPEEWEEMDFYAPKQVRGLRNAAVKGDVSAMSRYVETYIYKFEDFTGIYEPRRYRWVRTGDSKDIIFRYNSLDGKACEIKATAEGSNLVEYEYNDDYYDEHELYQIYAPKKVVVTVTCGGTELVKSTTTADVDMDAKTASFSTNTTVCNINIQANGSADNSKATATEVITISGKQFLSSTATVNGANMCDQVYWEKLTDEFDDGQYSRLANMIYDGTGKVDLMGAIQVRGTFTMNRELAALIGDMDCFCSYCYNNDENAAKAACKKACTTLNTQMEGKFYYDNSSAVEGRLVFEPYFEEWSYNSWEWEVRPCIEFADGTRYAFEGYFGDGNFASTENMFERLINRYRRLFN